MNRPPCHLADTDAGPVQYGFWAALQSVWDKLEQTIASNLNYNLKLEEHRLKRTQHWLTMFGRGSEFTAVE